MARDFTNPGSDPKRRYDGVGTARRQTAAGRLATARRIGRVRLFAFVAGLALLLGAMPRDATAKACESQRVRLGPGCVTASDIKKAPGISGEGDLTARDRMDEAGMAFDDRAQPGVIDRSNLDRRIFATVKKMKLPAGGVVIITASAVLGAMTVDTYGTVECDIIVEGPPPINRRVKERALVGSVDARVGLSFDSIAGMTGLTPSVKANLKIELSCRIDQREPDNVTFGKGRISFREPSLTVQYFPTVY